jgi:hypothetical protein
VWGCLAKVAVPIPKKVKIGPKTVDCVFIGYAHNSSAYRFLIHKSDIPDMHVNTIIESRNDHFLRKYLHVNLHKKEIPLIPLKGIWNLRLVPLMIKS